MYSGKKGKKIGKREKRGEKKGRKEGNTSNKEGKYPYFDHKERVKYP